MNLQISYLNFNFAMIHIIGKMSVLLTNHVNCLKDNIFVFSFKNYNRFLFF